MIDILLWIVVGIIFVILLVYGVSSLWVYREESKLKKISTHLRGLRTSLQTAAAAGHGYSPADPDPFGPLAKELNAELVSLDRTYRGLLEKYTRLQDAYRKAGSFAFPAVLRLPLDVYRLWKDQAALEKDQTAAQDALAGIDKTTADLRRMGWTVAENARRTLLEIRENMSQLAEIQAAGIHDPDLDLALGRGQRWEAAIVSQAPVVILSGGEADVLQEADKEMVARVHQMVVEANPDIQDLTNKSKEWREKLASLKKVLAELPEVYRFVDNAESALESVPNHPVQWDLSREPLANARQQIERLGDAKKPRTLQQLENERAAAQDLVARLTDMKHRVQVVGEQHAALVKLLEQPYIKDGVDWLRSMVKPVEQIETYDPENWARELEVEALREDLEEVAHLHRAILFESPDQPVKESALEGLLEKTQRLAELHQELRPRAGNIVRRLQQVQEVEKDSRDRLARARAVLSQASSVVASSKVLGPGAAEEAESLRQAIEPLEGEFSVPERGAVDKKVQRADALLRKADQAAGRWRERLDLELLGKKRTLAEKVARLQSIALLDEPVLVEAARYVKESGIEAAPAQEKSTPLDGARKILGRLGGLGETRHGAGEFELEGETGSMPGGKERGLAGYVAEIKRLNDEYQNCSILAKKIDEMDEYVINAYEAAFEARESALKLAARGTELLPEGKTWPPASLNLINERRQLSLLEQRWESLKETPVRAMQLVSTLGTLVGEYNAVSGNMRLILERVQGEQAKIVELEDRLNAVVQRWEKLKRDPSLDRAAQDDITALVSGVRQEQVDLRDRYLRGSISYNQALQSLRILSQRLDSAQIALQDGTIVDLGGESSDW